MGNQHAFKHGGRSAATLALRRELREVLRMVSGGD
jgi:hypothetical protein